MKKTRMRLQERFLFPCLLAGCVMQTFSPEAFGAIVATLPDELPPAVSEMPEMAALPWIDPSGFLPPRRAGANAADFYAKAAATIRQLPGFPSLPVDLKAYGEDPVLREAMRLAFEGATQEKADFFRAYSYRAWEEGSSPDLFGAFIVSRAMSRSARNYLNQSDPATAITVAKAAVGMGEHFLSQAPSLPQALTGQAIMKEGMKALVACYRETSDREKAGEAVDRCDKSAGLEEAVQIRSASAALLRWNNAAMAFKALSDADPVIRADAASLVEACFHPDGFRRMKEDGESAKIAVLIRADKDNCRKAVEPILNDPHPVVRRMAQQAMDALEKTP
jgi:hypothetical protein